ncbi:FAD binding domain-containing protein [Neofusicoccum parvum]|uniref:FAD binding domain-containing protein n=1 Tax=Neofusicoccum parvum TaxID=310453 RepID=A0ACB5S5H6_9PEZI|nr:FAD binding domain-containing protein [Neofusicoccum parvum]
MSPNSFRILIAGGSIAGLTLANILEQLGIDYLVLEGHSKIAPDLGASIGFFPNGLRILDQLGCYDAIRALIDEPIKYGNMRGPDGAILSSQAGLTDHMNKRHGYPVIFVHRQMIVQKLYENLKDKSKVLVNKKVVEVGQTGSTVTVKTEDGSSYKGDMLVGADGVHSKVRSEMWRLAHELQPEYFPSSEKTVSSYKCIFGISNETKGIAPLTFNYTMKENHSYLTMTGPSLYWFLFVRLEEQHDSLDLPRYTKDDEVKLAKTYWEDKVTEETTFGDIYTNRTASVLTILPEYVLTKWHFGRIITIGDSAHKFNPISGQGGNSAIESVAALANVLFKAMKSHPDGLSDAIVTQVFQETQALRSPRVSKLVKGAHDMQSLQALETPLLKFVALNVAPRTNPETAINIWSDVIVSAVSLDMLDVPKKPRFVPYDDEMPVKPLAHGNLPKLSVAAVLMALFAVACKTMQLEFPEEMTYNGKELRTTYTGLDGIDSLLSALVSAFSIPIAGPDPAQRVQCAYFLSMLAPPLVIWTVEAYRSGNNRFTTSWPTAWAALYQLLGIGKVAPLYYLASLHATGSTAYARPPGRAVPAAIAAAVLPATCLAYAVPTALMFLPHDGDRAAQAAIALWQPAPLCVGLATFLAGCAAHAVRRRQPPAPAAESYRNGDLPHLARAYFFVAAAAALVHVGTLLYVLARPSLGFARVFVPVGGGGGAGLVEAMAGFLKYDMLVFFAAVLVWCLYSVYDLRRMGYVTTGAAVGAAALVLGGQVVLGPGASYAGLWYWREFVISGVSR